MKGAAKKERSVLQTAIWFLSRREYSQHELRRKLAERDFSEEQIEHALGRLVEEDLQSDERFAKCAIRSRASAGRGPRRIQAELAQHALQDGSARDLLEEEQIDWDANARALVARRYGEGCLDFNTRRKAMNFLLGRGFSMETARLATNPQAES